MSNDLLDGIAKCRIAFKAANIEPPSVMLLKSRDEGMRFLSAMRQSIYWNAIIGDPSLGKPLEMADGSVWMEIIIMETAIRWPANRIATEDGSWLYF